MPSRNGVTRPTADVAEETRKQFARQALRHVAQRHPVELGVFAIDLAGEPVEIALEFAIFADILARARRHLQVAHLLAVLGEALEQFRIGVETLRQSLRIVEPVGADDQLAAGKTLFQPLRIPSLRSRPFRQCARRPWRRCRPEWRPRAAWPARTDLPSDPAEQACSTQSRKLPRSSSVWKPDDVIGGEIGQQFAAPAAGCRRRPAAETECAERSRSRFGMPRRAQCASRAGSDDSREPR